MITLGIVTNIINFMLCFLGHDLITRVLEDIINFVERRVLGTENDIDDTAILPILDTLKGYIGLLDKK